MKSASGRRGERDGMPAKHGLMTSEGKSLGKPTLFQLATIKAIYDLDRACIQLHDSAKELVNHPTLESFSRFCLANRIAWHECYDSALMDGEFSPVHLEAFISCSSRQDVTDAFDTVLSRSRVDDREMASHYLDNIRRRLQFARMALQGGLDFVYEDQRRESLTRIQQSVEPKIAATRPAMERALNIEDAPVVLHGGDLESDESLLNFTKTTIAWLRHRLLLQLTELLFERGPYATAVPSHLTIAHSISHCFKIALQISGDRDDPSRETPAVYAELPELLVDFDNSVVALLDKASREVDSDHTHESYSVDERETRAQGFLVDAFVNVSQLLARLSECSELLRYSWPSVSSSVQTDNKSRVLLYKRAGTYYAHDLDRDLVGHDESSYEEAIELLTELQSIDSARRGATGPVVIAPARPAPSRLIAAWDRAASYPVALAPSTGPIDARLES